MGLQLGQQAGLQVCPFLGSTSRNRFGLEVAHFSSLLDVAFDGSQRDAQRLYTLLLRFPLVDCT
jgi:hypothetical protein